MNGSIAPIGGIVNIINGSVNGSYTASYEWDPDNNTAPGMYDLYFSVEDETKAHIEDNFDNNKDELRLMGTGIITPTVNPNLTEPEIHHDHDAWHNFSINYTHPENLLPDADGVILVLDGEEYKMKEANTSDENVTDGKIYYYRYELAPHEYHYSFKVNDTLGGGIELEEQTYKPEGADDHHHDDEHHETPDTGWQVNLTILLIIIILILLLLMARIGKGFGAGEDEGEREAPPPPMAEPIDEPLPEEPIGSGDDIIPEAKPIDTLEISQAPAMALPVEETEDKKE
jgi:hypothetical protein